MCRGLKKSSRAGNASGRTRGSGYTSTTGKKDRPYRGLPGRLSAVFLALVMVLGSVNVPVFAAEGNGHNVFGFSVEKDASDDAGLDSAGKNDQTDITQENDVTENGADVVPEDGTAGESAVKTGNVITDTPQLSTISTPDGLDYKVTATFGPETGLPSEAELSVTEVEKTARAVDKAVDKARPEGVHVAKSRTFDISILDSDGNELQPAEGTTVEVRFEMEGIDKQNLSTNIYHLEKKWFSYSAKSLGVTVDKDAAMVTTDGFSLYTVEFTYEGQQYVLDGESVVRLDEVLESIGITGNIEAAEVSDSTKFETHHSWDGNWYVYGLQPFDTEEWMKVTVDGMVYEITVTDAFYGNSASGSAATTFANGMDIGTIVLQELGNYSNRTITLNNNTDLGITDTRQIYWSGTIAKSGKQKLSGDQVTIKYPGAAKTADGILCDVEVVISDVTIYGDTRTSLNARFAFATVDAWLSSGVYAPVAVTAQYMGDKNDIASYVTTDGSITAGQSRFGVGETITVNVYQAGTSTPVSGTFVMTAHDLNLNKTNTSWQYITEASSHHTFSEYVTVDGSRNDVYYNTSKLTRSGNDIYPSGNNGGAKSYETGLAILATSGTSFRGYNGTDSLGTNFYVMPRGGINYTIESYSGNGGSIATTTTGAWESDGSVPSDATELDGGTTSDPRTYVVPSGKAVTYKMTPDSGYYLKALYVDGTQIASADSNGSPVAVDGYTVTQDSNGSIYYTFPAVGDTHKINVEWEPGSDPELSLGHVAMIPGSNGAVAYTDLQSLVDSNHQTTTIPKNGTVKTLGTSLTPPTTLTSGSVTYKRFTYALGYSESGGIPSTFYAASDDLSLSYTSSGEIQYCVNYTGTDSDTWETWSVKDSNGDATFPTVYAIYTKQDTEDTHTVYVTLSAIAKNTTDAGFVNPNMAISFTEVMTMYTYTVKITNPNSDDWANNVTVTRTSEEVYNSTHTHKPGETHSHSMSYTTATDTAALNSSDTVTLTIQVPAGSVTETAPDNYKLTSIDLKSSKRGTATIDSSNASGTYTLYGANTSLATNPADDLSITRETSDTGYTFSVNPKSFPGNTEVEFVNTRDTVKLKLKELLEDASMGTADTDTHPFAVTLRAREQWTDANGSTREHYSMLGTYTITPKNMDKSGASSTVQVPANADILIIQRYGDTSETNSSVKVTNYDTEVTSDKKDADNNDIVQPYRPLAKEYIIAPIREDTTVTLKNTLMPRTVTVKKTMVGGDTSSTFNFTAKLEKGGNALKDYVVYYDAGGDEVKTDNKGEVSFTLSGNGSIDLKMPYGTKLTVTEEDGDDFTEAYSVENAAAVTSNKAVLNGDGSGITAKNTELVFTNTSEFSVYNPESIVTYEFYLDENCTEPYKYTLAAYGDVQETTNKQILRKGSVLVLPEQPVSSTASEVFQGWYVKGKSTEFTDFGKTISFDSSDSSDSTKIVATAGGTVKLYAKFGAKLYAVFHENKTTDSSNEYWPVMKTVAVEKNSESKYVIDLSAYTPVIEDAHRSFVAWAASAGDAAAGIRIGSSNSDTAYTAYELTANQHFYPIFEEKAIVSFYTGESGSGATYIAPVNVTKGTKTSTVLTGVSDPSYKGYVFGGWYYDEALTDAYSSNDKEITEDITLYAKWNLPDSATYKVVIWTQDADDAPGTAFADMNWEYAGTYSGFTHTYNKTDDSKNFVTPTADAIKAKKDLGDNFIFQTAETKYIEPDGSTVINAYYVRAHYSVIIKKGNAWYGGVNTSNYIATSDYDRTDLYGRVGEEGNVDYVKISRVKVWKDASGNEYAISDNITPSVFLSYTTSTWRRGLRTYTKLDQGYLAANNDVAEGTSGTILYDIYGTQLRYTSDGSGNTTLVAGEWSYLDMDSAKAVTVAYVWKTEGGDTYDISNGAYYTNSDPTILATYEGLYQGHFDRMEKLSKLLGEDQEAYFWTKASTGSGNAALPLDMFDFSLVESSTNDNKNTLSDRGTTVTIYGQTTYKGTDTAKSGIKLYIDYYRLPAGKTLSTFKTDEIINKVSTIIYGADESPAADIRDSKIRVASDSSDYVKSVLYLNGTQVSGSYRSVFANNNKIVSRYELSAKVFDGYQAKRYLSYYHGNGKSFTNNGSTSTWFGENKFYLAADKEIARNGDKMYFRVASNTKDYSNDNVYGLLYNTNRNGAGTNYYQGLSTITNAANAYYTLKIICVPDKHNVEFYSDSTSSTPTATLQVYTDWSLNQSEKKWDGTADYVTGSGSITQKAAYTDYLAKGKNLSGATITDPKNENRVFKGWYYDEECTDENKFNPDVAITTDIKLYAKWEPVKYVVQVDPNGGVLTGGEGGSTWIYMDYGGTVTPYNSFLKREYDESDDGTFYYQNYQYDELEVTDSDETSGVHIGGYYDEETDIAKGVKSFPRTAKYIEPAEGETVSLNDGKTYRYLPGVWKLMPNDWQYQWYDTENNKWPDEWQSGYVFTTQITNHLRLRAVWEKTATFTIRYDLNGGTLVEPDSGSPLDSIYSTGTKDTGTYTESEKYLDGAELTINRSAKSSDDNKHFLGWKVQGSTDTTRYTLGSSYTVSSEDADSDLTITLVAQYGDMNVTSLMYDANGGEGSLTDLAAATGSTQVVDSENSTLRNIELNDTVTLSKGEGFTRSGYQIVGWCRQSVVDTATPDAFTENTDGTTTVNSGYTGYFGLGQDVIVDGATGNRLYAVWKEVPTVKLSVTKKVTGGFADYNQEFDFTISGLSDGAKVKWQKYNSTDGTNYTEITKLSGGSSTTNAGSDGKITFKLKHNQKIELAIPKDADITVKEATESFYTTTMKTSDDSTESSVSSKVITMSDDKSLAVVNNMTEVAPTGVNMHIWPFVLIFIAGGTLILTMRRRKRT